MLPFQIPISAPIVAECVPHRDVIGDREPQVHLNKSKTRVLLARGFSEENTDKLHQMSDVTSSTATASNYHDVTQQLSEALTSLARNSKLETVMSLTQLLQEEVRRTLLKKTEVAGALQPRDKRAPRRNGKVAKIL